MQMDLIAFSILTKYFNYIKKEQETSSLDERIKHRHMKKKTVFVSRIFVWNLSDVKDFMAI